MVGVLKKEVMKTQSKELEKGAEYRQLLVQAIHSWCVPGSCSCVHRTSFSAARAVVIPPPETLIIDCRNNNVVWDPLRNVTICVAVPFLYQSCSYRT